MNSIVLPNLLLVIGVVATLAVVCRLPYRLGPSQRLEEHLAAPEPTLEREPERQAA